MNKKSLADLLAKRTGMQKNESVFAVDSLCQIITERLTAGEKVVINGFGTFAMKERAPRTGREPKGGVEVHIPARYVPNFKPSKRLKEVTIRPIA